ncbi:MAG: hypothetical protein MRJ96_14920 [Nitrospirales bacterium]|nr:hypothetical protein [Nitrospira sp.]MDR4502734.1 hypothetical protein [Nitrospirales bacterium]
MATEHKTPLHKLKVGSAQVAIWEQTPEKGKPFLTVTLSRSYKDKSDQWKTGHSFTFEQIESAIEGSIPENG